jgi:hypothetical protein
MQTQFGRLAVAITLGLILGALTFGCAPAPIIAPPSLDEVQSVFEAAKFTDAATKSPYEFYSAEIYLKKAINEAELGNEELSEIYLIKAHERARLAYENAKRYQGAQ